MLRVEKSFLLDTTFEEIQKEIEAGYIRKASHPKYPNLEIYNYTDKGAFLFSKERYIVFIDKKEMKTRPRVGETVTARVTFLREDGRLNASLREIKEKAMVTDSDAILALMRERHGRMPYSDETSPEIIRDKFGISKAAFKRALGHLLKEGKIEQRDGWTFLREST